MVKNGGVLVGFRLVELREIKFLWEVGVCVLELLRENGGGVVGFNEEEEWLKSLNHASSEVELGQC